MEANQHLDTNIEQASTVIIDTNVFLDNPEILDIAQFHRAVIPMVVIEELDNIRNGGGLMALPARRAVRSIDRYLMYLREGRIQREVVIDDSFPRMLPADDVILETAKRHDGCVLLTNDLAMRVKAFAMGVRALPYPFGEADEDEYETREIFLPPEAISELYKEGRILYKEGHLYPNEYVIIRDVEGSSQSALARYQPDGYLALVRPKTPWQVRHRNTEQLFAIDALMDDSIPVVVLTGVAGTGKTMLSLAAAFEQVIEKGLYQKVLIAKPTVPVGRDIGFLPGTKEEKLQVWLQNYSDNAEELFGSRDTFEMYVQTGIIEMESLAHIRGRSLKQSFIIIDEVQNCSLHEIKTFLTRVGESSKIVLLGDLTQIDNERITKATSGLSVLVDKGRESDLVAHVHLTDARARSTVAAWATRAL